MSEEVFTTSALTRERGQIGTAFAGLLVALSFLVTSGIVDGEGRKPWHHSGPVPANVVQLSAESYLIEREADLIPEQICKVPSGYSPTDEVRTTSDGGLFVQCNHSQTWNDDRALSRDFWSSAAVVGTSLVYWGVLAAVCALMFVPYLVSRRREKRAFRARIKSEQRDREARQLEREKANDATRTELRVAYARGEITLEQFESGLERVMARDT